MDYTVSVKLGSEKDFKEYLHKIRAWDRRTLLIYWRKALRTGRFLTLSKQTPYSSAVYLIPQSVLPALQDFKKTNKIVKFRMGWLGVPTPARTYLVFGKDVRDEPPIKI